MTKTQSARSISCLEHHATRVLHCTILTTAATLMYSLYSRPLSVVRWGHGGWGVRKRKVVTSRHDISAMWRKRQRTQKRTSGFCRQPHMPVAQQTSRHRPDCVRACLRHGWRDEWPCREILPLLTAHRHYCTVPRLQRHSMPTTRREIQRTRWQPR